MEECQSPIFAEKGRYASGEYIGEGRCQHLKMGFLPEAFSHMGGSACGATAHAAVHGAVHDAFMTLPAYTRISEGEVHSLGLGVRNGSHRALADPLSEQSERIERACEALQPKGQRVAHPVGNPFPGGFSCSRAQKEAGALPRGVPSGRAHGRQLC